MMQTDENTITGITDSSVNKQIDLKDLVHLSQAELGAYRYMESFQDNEPLAFYFEDDRLSKFSDLRMKSAVDVLFPNIESYFEITHLGTFELLRMVRDRKDLVQETGLSNKAFNELVEYQKSITSAPQIPGAELEGSIEPILETDSAVAALKKSELNRTLLNGLYVEREPNAFYRIDSDKPALIDEGMKLKVINKDLETFKAAIELAESKGWVGIQVNGTDKFKAEAWYQASIKGLTVKGYEPNEKDKQRMAEYHLVKTPVLNVAEQEQLIASRQAAENYALERDAGIAYPDKTNETRNFSGRVAQVFDNHVVQDIGRKTFVIHEKSRVGEVREGAKLDILYQGKTAKVSEINNKSNSLER